MADVELTTVVPGDLVDYIKSATEKIHNAGEPLTNAEAKTMLQNEWRDHLKQMVANSESVTAANAQRVVINELLAAWNGA